MCPLLIHLVYVIVQPGVTFETGKLITFKVIKELTFILVTKKDVITVITTVHNVVVCTDASRYEIRSRLMYLLYNNLYNFPTFQRTDNHIEGFLLRYRKHPDFFNVRLALLGSLTFL